MRAVNLIPGESGRAAGAGPFVLLGILGVLLVGALAYVLTNNTVVDRRAELASVQTQAQAAQAQAAAVQPYREFAALANARVETVRQLGETRFDWHRAFGDLARVIPENVWLSSLVGTVTTGVSVGSAASASTSSLRAALPNPAIELSGCTTSQDNVARMISRLRLMTGVVRVSLGDTSKDEVSGDDCRHGHAGFPQFGIVVFFDPLPSAPAPSATAATGGTDAAATPSPAAQSTPSPAASGDDTGGSMR